MANSPANFDYDRILGAFDNKETGVRFDWKAANTEGNERLLDHLNINAEVFVDYEGGTRFASVKKTVAYIVIDEDGEGNPIIEKWDIRTIWRRHGS